MTNRTNHALAIVDPERSTVHQPATRDNVVQLQAAKNRTQAEVYRRIETDTAAIIGKGMEAAIAVEVNYELTRRSLHYQVEAIVEGNELVREQQYQADADDVQAVVDQNKKIHNTAQQHVLSSALNAIGEIIDRPLIVDDERDNLQRFQDRVWGVLTGEKPRG